VTGVRFKKDNVERIAMTTEDAAKLKSMGFCEMAEAPRTPKEEKGGPDLSRMNLKELREQAKAMGITGGDVLTKEELMKALESVNANG